MHLLASSENLAILTALAAGAEYPRRLAGRLQRGETQVARRLRILEQAGFVQGEWSREEGKNVRLYWLRTRTIAVAIDAAGIRVDLPALAASREPPSLEQVPPRRPVFGREREWASLLDAGVRFAMVVGLPGMGKTSLAIELAYRHGVERVVWHTFTAFDSSWRLLALARQWLALFDLPSSRESGEANADVAELLSQVTDRLSRQHVLIVLDDYHKVHDQGIHEIVRRWKQAFVNARIIVLARSRPPFDVDSTTQLIMLRGLSRAASRDLLQDSGLHVSPEELSQLNRAFGGHPLSLRLYALQPGSIPGTARPAVEDLGREAFQGLDRASQQLLLALAAVRRPLGLEGIRFLTGQNDPTLPLAMLERQAMIRSERGRYEIHDVLREALAPMVASRPEIHRRALALFLPSESVDDLTEALHHAAKAGDWHVAENLLEKDLAEQRDLPSGSVHPSILLEILDGIPAKQLDARYRAMFHRSHALALLGTTRNSAVIRELETARLIAEPLGDSRLLSWILSPLGFHMAQVGRMVTAERLLMRNLLLVESEGRLADKADALFVLALLWDRRGIHGRAKDYWRLALEAARQTGNKRLIGELSSWHVAFPSDWREMVPRLQRWRANFRRWGMPRQVAGMDCLSGEILCRTERYRKIPRGKNARRAVNLLEGSITAFDAIGDRYEALYARSWLALAFFLAKEYERAEATAKAVLEDDRRLGPGYCAILGHQVLSRLCERRRDMAAAREHLDIAVRVARRLQCGSVGIALLERATQEERSSGGMGARGLMERAIAETVSKGYPDEVQYARRLARLHRLELPRYLEEVGTQFGQLGTAGGRKSSEALLPG